MKTIIEKTMNTEPEEGDTPQAELERSSSDIKDLIDKNPIEDDPLADPDSVEQSMTPSDDSISGISQEEIDKKVSALQDIYNDLSSFTKSDMEQAQVGPSPSTIVNLEDEAEEIASAWIPDFLDMLDERIILVKSGKLGKPSFRKRVTIGATMVKAMLSWMRHAKSQIDWVATASKAGQVLVVATLAATQAVISLVSLIGPALQVGVKVIGQLAKIGVEVASGIAQAVATASSGSSSSSSSGEGTRWVSGSSNAMRNNLGSDSISEAVERMYNKILNNLDEGARFLIEINEQDMKQYLYDSILSEITAVPRLSNIILKEEVEPEVEKPVLSQEHMLSIRSRIRRARSKFLVTELDDVYTEDLQRYLEHIENLFKTVAEQRYVNERRQLQGAALQILEERNNSTMKIAKQRLRQIIKEELEKTNAKKKPNSHKNKKASFYKKVPFMGEVFEYEGVVVIEGQFQITKFSKDRRLLTFDTPGLLESYIGKTIAGHGYISNLLRGQERQFEGWRIPSDIKGNLRIKDEKDVIDCDSGDCSVDDLFGPPTGGGRTRDDKAELQTRLVDLTPALTKAGIKNKQRK
jgi:hypothetical protein